jgi:hypothetical protein
MHEGPRLSYRGEEIVRQTRLHGSRDTCSTVIETTSQTVEVANTLRVDSLESELEMILTSRASTVHK